MNPLRVLTITSGVEAVLTTAAMLSSITNAATERRDVSFAEAADALRALSPDSVDLALIAYHVSDRAPDLLREIATIAAQTVAEVLLLTPPDAPPVDRLPQGVNILRGPPFPRGPFDEIMALARSPGVAVPPPGAAPERPRVSVARLLKRGAAGGRAAAEPSTARRQCCVILSGCGGAGATTLCANLAFAFAGEGAAGQGGGPNVCALDLNVQSGSLGAYLDLPENPQLRDAYRTIGRLDAEGFQNCLQFPAPGLAAVQTPDEIMPLDALSAESVGDLIDLARETAPVVLIDMPHALPDWSERVLNEADRIICVSALELRSAQFVRRLDRLLGATAPARGRLQHVINRAPAKRGRDWAETLAAFEEAARQPVFAILPDGGPEVRASCDAGTVLWTSHPRNPLTVAIRDLAARLAPLAAPPGPAAREA